VEPVVPNPWPSGEWLRHLSEAVRDVDELLRLLALDDRALIETPAAARRFPLRVPRGFVARMRAGDSEDPLLRQVLPSRDEDNPVPGFTADPVGELLHAPADGVLHKYRGRALVVATGACAVHCRYCFRRHFPYGDPGGSAVDLQKTIDHLASDREISEVILSGGDPLTLTDRRLSALAGAVTRIPRVRRLRIHTRLPIVLPQRVDEELVGWLSSLDLPTVVVVHANHAQEIDADVRRALAALGSTGATLLNQSVLLAGVNESADALIDLSESLFDAGVLPYYLHLLDPVAGAAHFEVAEDEAVRIHRELTTRLPGYLVPRLVREVPGAPAKVGVDLWK
jgi:EF-P beta-lysylation protein EpmB